MALLGPGARGPPGAGVLGWNWGGGDEIELKIISGPIQVNSGEVGGEGLGAKSA